MSIPSETTVEENHSPSTTPLYSILRIARAAQPEPRPLRVASVEHVRAFAVLLLIYHQGMRLLSGEPLPAIPFDWGHAHTATNPLWALLFEGHSGASLWLVACAFSATLRAGRAPVDPRTFWLERLRSTYPPFVFVMLIGTAVHFDGISYTSLLETVLGGANLAGAQPLGSFSGMFWLFALEWQFYLIFPALMALLVRSGVRAVALVAIMAVSVRILVQWGGLAAGIGLHSQLLGRIDQLILGMVAGWFFSDVRQHRFCQYLLAPAIGGLLLGACLLNHWDEGIFRPDFGVIGSTLEGALWALFVLGYAGVGECLTRYPSAVSRGLTALGRGSSALLLCHVPLLALQQRYVGRLHWLASLELNQLLLLTLISVPAIIILSLLLDRVVHAPFADRSSRADTEDSGAALV